MADAIGTLEFPAQTQPAGEALSDATLQKFLDYLTAYLRENLEANWQQVAPSIPIIRTTGLCNPEIAGLNNGDLPGLYVWRSRMQQERMADDWYVDHSEISVMWLPDPVTQVQVAKRIPFLNGVAKAIYMAIVLGRSPVWVDAGDPDPDASTLGSVLASRANLIMQPVLTHCEAAVASVRNDKETARYPCVRARIDAHELSIWDISLRGDSPPAHQTTLSIAGQTVDVVRDPPTPDP